MELKKRDYLSDAILIAIMPVIAYLIVYAYEFGYAQSFNIPVELIIINKTTFFIVASSLWVILFPVISLINIVIMIFKDDSSIIYRIFTRVAPIYIFIFPLILIYGKILDFIVLISTIFFIVILTSGYFILPLLTQRKVTGGYKQKLLAQEKLDIETTQNRGFYLHKYINKLGINIIMYTFMIIILSYSAGYAEVFTKEEYYIIQNSDNVILRMYGDNLVTAKFNRIDNEVYSNFTIRKLEEPDMVITTENLGVLKPTHK